MWPWSKFNDYNLNVNICASLSATLCGSATADGDSIRPNTDIDNACKGHWSLALPADNTVYDYAQPMARPDASPGPL